jgi:hypothetical protein
MLTNVVSNGKPSVLMGNVFNSMPKWEKSCSALLPAVAPNAVSSNIPTQPLSRFKSGGTGIFNSSASSPKVNPAIDCAFSNKACSVCGIMRGISSIISV